MASENAKAVAQEVIKTLGKSRKVVLRKIARDKGYSPHTADTPKNITDTKSYQAEIAPVVKQMELERDEVIKRLRATRDRAKYRDLMDGLDKLTKNIQLLSGGKTANEEIKISWK